jgi:hypothetical protein
MAERLPFLQKKIVCLFGTEKTSQNLYVDVHARHMCMEEPHAHVRGRMGAIGARPCSIVSYLSTSSFRKQGAPRTCLGTVVHYIAPTWHDQCHDPRERGRHRSRARVCTERDRHTTLPRKFWQAVTILGIKLVVQWDMQFVTRLPQIILLQSTRTTPTILFLSTPSDRK